MDSTADNQEVIDRPVEVPPNMGIEEALDFLDKQGTSDSDSTITDEERETMDDDTSDVSELDEDSDPDPDPDEDEDEDEERTDEGEDGDGEDDGEDEDAFLFTVKDEDGNEVGVTAEEAEDGYMRRKHYTRERQKDAQARRELEAEKTELLEVKSKYLEGLHELKAMASEELGRFYGIDWEGLQKEDPYGFDQRKGEFEAAKLKYESTVQQKEALESELTKESIEYAQKVRSEEMGKLSSFYPEVLEGDSGIMARAREFGISTYGFEEAELNSIYDHRVIRVLLDAYKASQQAEKVQKGKSKLKKIPKTMKSKGRKDLGTSKQRKTRQLRERLRSTGSIDDALELLSTGQ